MAESEQILLNKTATQLLGEGIRAYTIGDHNGAVQFLSKASEVVVAEHDEKHDSLGDIYLYYGKALLEVARAECDPLGDAVPRELNDEDDDDDDEEVDAAETAEAGKEQDKPEEANINAKNKKAGAATAEAEKKSGEDKKPEAAKPAAEKAEAEKPEAEKLEAEKPEDGKKEEEKSEASGAAKEEDTTEDTAEDPAAEKEEDPSDLQLAWEVLELAKIILEKRGDEGKEDLAEALIVLGEVSMESENFESAIADIKQGLEMQASLYGRCSRKLAETYYKLGIALSTNSQIDEAIENFQSSLEILVERIALLEKDATKNDDELNEVKCLIPEIEEKIVDMRNFKKEAAKKLADEIQLQAPSTPEKKANDISHLVKRKRKLEDIVEAAAAGKSGKKPSP